MYVYIDESGNTGNKLFDLNQPYFYAGALVTSADFDEAYSEKVKALADGLEAGVLHANKLGVGEIEKIALDIVNILNETKAFFCVSYVEKVYLAYAKFVDTYFDQGENEAVPYECYWLIKLRFSWILSLKEANIVTEDCVEALWKCFSADKAEDAEKYFIESATIALERVPLIKEKQIRRLTEKALKWAIAHPKEFCLVNNPSEVVFRDSSGEFGTIKDPKTAVYEHSPNFSGFMQLLDMIEKYSNLEGKKIYSITHDIQLDLKKVFERWHAFLSRPELANLTAPWPGEKNPIALGFASGSDFSMLADERSAGLQIVDILLWLYKRKKEGKSLGENCEKLLEYLGQSFMNEMSFEGAMQRVVES